MPIAPRVMSLSASASASPASLRQGLRMPFSGASKKTLTQLSMSDVASTPEEPKKGFLGALKNMVPPAKERQKLFPLALMFFCILFNYTILRDTKDVLMITAPKSGAEVIPFIKTYFNLPVAIVRIDRI
jgi:AAA family ATP:ADP antiporter